MCNTKARCQQWENLGKGIIYRNSVYFLHNFSVNLKLFLKKKAEVD